MLLIYKKKISILLILIILLGVFSLSAPAEAQSGELGGSIGFIEKQALISIANWFLEILSSVFALLANILKATLALSVSAVTDLRDASGTPDNDAIGVAWRLIRNMVNMIFVLLLVFISFGTIFDTQYGAKYTLGRLLTAALLVNFSLLIGKIVIDFSNIVSVSILNSFGGVEGFVDKFTQTLQLQNVYPGEEGLTEYLSNLYNRASVPTAVLSSTIFALIFTSAAIFATLVGTVLIVLRIPFLWAILIFSPVAWASFVLPSTRKNWTMWWNKLIEWSFVLPLYLFFMYLGIFFAFNAFFATGFEDYISEIDISANTGLLNNFFRDFKRLFVFILSMVFMLGGAFFAKKLSGDLGGFTSKFQNYLGGQIRGRLADYTGAGVAWKQFKETGRIGSVKTPYGGEQARRLRQARGADRWQPGALVKQQEAEVNKEKQALATKRLTMNENEFRQEISQLQGDDPRAMAAQLLLAEQGMASYKDEEGNVQTREMTKDDIVGFLGRADGDRTPLGQQFIQNLEKSKILNKLDIEEKKRILQGNDEGTNEYINLRKAIGKNMISQNAAVAAEHAKDMLEIMTPEERDQWIEETKWEKVGGKIDSIEGRRAAVTGLKDLRTSEQLDKETIEKIEKKLDEFNPAIVAEATGKNVKEVLGDRLKKNDPEAIAKYLGNVVKTHSKETNDALSGFNPDDIKDMVTKAKKETLSALNDLGYATKTRKKEDKS